MAAVAGELERVVHRVLLLHIRRATAVLEVVDALAAHEARKNVIIAAETYKFSPRSLLGELIEIEERSTSEVIPSEKLKEFKNVSVKNPAFDVTPREYIDLICTEVGAIPPEMAYIIIKDYLGWSIGDINSKGMG